MNTAGMASYMNLSGQSNVVAYRCNAGSITVEFAGGRWRFYLYTNSSAGAATISMMQRLAEEGSGLNSFIDHFAKRSYAERV